MGSFLGTELAFLVSFFKYFLTHGLASRISVETFSVISLLLSFSVAVQAAITVKTIRILILLVVMMLMDVILVPFIVDDLKDCVLMIESSTYRSVIR